MISIFDKIDAIVPAIHGVIRFLKATSFRGLESISRRQFEIIALIDSKDYFCPAGSLYKMQPQTYLKISSGSHKLQIKIPRLFIAERVRG